MTTQNAKISRRSNRIVHYFNREKRGSFTLQKAMTISGMGKRLPRFARNDKEEIVRNDKRKRARNDRWGKWRGGKPTAINRVDGQRSLPLFVSKAKIEACGT